MPKIYSDNFKRSVINFYNSDLFSISNSLLIFNISKSTLYNWINFYTHTNNFLNERSNYFSKISNEVKKCIIAYVMKRTIFSMKKLRKYILRIFNV
jgi:transposase